jgi:uncharacterized protein (UPF0261 family)
MHEPLSSDLESKKAYVVGTLDTKGEELEYIRDILRSRHVGTCVVDIATRKTRSEADVSSETVAAHHPVSPDLVFSEDRGQAIQSMSEDLYDSGQRRARKFLTQLCSRCS